MVSQNIGTCKHHTFKSFCESERKVRRQVKSFSSEVFDLHEICSQK